MESDDSPHTISLNSVLRDFPCKLILMSLTRLVNLTAAFLNFPRTFRTSHINREIVVRS